MNTTTTALNTLTTLAALRPALQAARAYGKVARYNVDAMRAYAAKVAEVRAAGNIEELTADNVDAVLATVRADAEAAAAALVAAAAVVAAPAPKARKVRPLAIVADAPAAVEGAEPTCWMVMVTLTAANVDAIVALWPSLQGAVTVGQVVVLRTTATMEAAAAHSKNSELQDYDAWTAGADMQVAHGTVAAAKAGAMPRPEGYSKTALVRAARAARAAAKA